MKKSIVSCLAIIAIFVSSSSLVYGVNIVEGTITGKRNLENGYIEWTMSDKDATKVVTDVKGKHYDKMTKHMKEKNLIRVGYDPKSEKHKNWVKWIAQVKKT